MPKGKGNNAGSRWFRSGLPLAMHAVVRTAETKPKIPMAGVMTIIICAMAHPVYYLLMSHINTQPLKSVLQLIICPAIG